LNYVEIEGVFVVEKMDKKEEEMGKRKMRIDRQVIN
jgi:hypothetical protein